LIVRGFQKSCPRPIPETSKIFWEEHEKISFTVRIGWRLFGCAYGGTRPWLLTNSPNFIAKRARRPGAIDRRTVFKGCDWNQSQYDPAKSSCETFCPDQRQKLAKSKGRYLVGAVRAIHNLQAAEEKLELKLMFLPMRAKDCKDWVHFTGKPSAGGQDNRIYSVPLLWLQMKNLLTKNNLPVPACWKPDLLKAGI